MPDTQRERAYRLDLAIGQMRDRKRTPQGGLVVDANLTKTGVFSYRMPDGSTRRELRHPDEVFDAQSRASYPLAPVTVDHPGKVGPNNWKTHAVGTHGPTPPRQAGDFLAGELHLQHQDAIDRAESGDLHDVSCGYTCDIDPVPGEYRGQPYDVAQRNIRINHIAIGPKGWGRMGTDTRMKLDSAEAVSGESDVGHYVRDASQETTRSSTMTPEEKAALEKAQADAQKATADLEKARQDAKDAKTEGEKLAAQARADAAEIAKLKAENDALKLQNERNKQDRASDETRTREDAAFEKRVEEMIQLRADARMVFASTEDPEGKNWKSDGKGPDQIRLDVIAHLEPKLRLDGVKAIPDAHARSEALKSVYETVIGHKRATDQARSDALKAASGERSDTDGTGGGNGDDDEAYDAAKARKAMVDRKKNDWKKKDARSGAKA